MALKMIERNPLPDTTVLNQDPLGIQPADVRNCTRSCKRVEQERDAGGGSGEKPAGDGDGEAASESDAMAAGSSARRPCYAGLQEFQRIYRVWDCV